MALFKGLIGLLQGAVELITAPPGDLFYHLWTLFAVQLVLGIAFGHWYRHRRDPAATRMLVAGAGFALAHASLMVIAGLSRVGVPSSGALLPPLERALDFAIVLLAVWAFLPVLEQRSRPGIGLLLLIFVTAAGVSVVFYWIWRGAKVQLGSYGGYWGLWELSHVVILLLAFLASLIWRRGDWSLAACLFFLWLVGHAVQLAYPLISDSDSRIAGWVRLANLGTLPLLAGLVYRRVLEGAPAAGGDIDLELIGILKAVRRIEVARDVEAALGLAASSIARALQADMVAIGLPVSGSPREVHILALHPPTSATLAQPELKLRVSGYPVLATALHTNHLQRALAPRKDPTVAALYRSLGFERPGPLLVQPLVEGEKQLAVMLIGNPVSRQSWTAHDEQVVQAVGAAIAGALVSAESRDTVDRSAELQEALIEASRQAQRVADLEGELKQQRQRAEELATKLRLQQHETAGQDIAVSETTVWQEEVRDLAEARTALEAELAEWRKKAEQLAHSKDDLQIQLAKAQAELQGAQAPEEEKTVQTDVLASLIDELRAPMTSITLHTDQLLAETVGILGEKQRQFLQRIQANIERMGRLLDDLVRVTTIDVGQAPTSQRPVDIVNVIDEVVTSLSSHLSERQLTVQRDIPSTLPPVYMDPDSLRVVVLNLLSNASRCSQPGSEILVQASVEEHDGQVKGLPDYLLVSVTDTGGGITPEDQRRIFQHLRQADSPPIPGLGETGTGLSVAKSQVEANGGRIWVESEMGAGSTFSFILPISSEDDGGSSARLR